MDKVRIRMTGGVQGEDLEHWPEESEQEASPAFAAALIRRGRAVRVLEAAAPQTSAEPTREQNVEQRDPQPETREPVIEQRDPQPQTQDPQPGTRDPELENREPVIEQRDPQPQTREAAPPPAVSRTKRGSGKRK